MIKFGAENPSSNGYGVFQVSGGALYYSGSSLDSVKGSIIPNGNLEKITLQESEGVSLASAEQPVPGIFLIRGYATNIGETISVNLAQFKDENGAMLSGKLLIIYNGEKWIVSVIN